MRNEKKYKFYIPGSMGYMEFYGINEHDARATARSWLGVKRLPNDTFVELANYQSEQMIMQNNRDMIKGIMLCTTDLY